MLKDDMVKTSYVYFKCPKEKTYLFYHEMDLFPLYMFKFALDRQLVDDIDDPSPVQLVAFPFKDT